ncbi:MAG: hypothetical protein ACD_48C00484G0002 [uncultured bacterium]|nr:MAG: hypothetical protein ACD_48C00484G0002 [uncultured bacterium]
MSYCEVIQSSCHRFPKGDIGHCHDCSESLIVIFDGVQKHGFQEYEVQIIPSSMRHEIGAYDKSTGLLVIGVTHGQIHK